MTATHAKTVPAAVGHPTCPECGSYLFESITAWLYCIRPGCERRNQPAGRADRDTGCLPEDLREVGT